jgi:Domain of unknown function (DUF4365)
MIKKSNQQEIDRAGRRLLREVLESLKWVVNDVQEDYGIDSNVQIFDAESPTGTWFHVQLKSSESSRYIDGGAFVSQELSIDHARHYSLEMREPVLLVHADLASRAVYWHAPQLDVDLLQVVRNTAAKYVRIRIRTHRRLPETATELLSALEDIHLALANRVLTSASTQSFAGSLRDLPDQEALFRAFQDKNDTLRLRRSYGCFIEGKLDEAQLRVEAILGDPDSTVEVRFWAHLQSEAIDYKKTVHSGVPQSQLSQVHLKHAKLLQKLTASGPRHLKFYALIVKKAAELDVLSHQSFCAFMAQRQHLESHGDPMLAIALFARRSILTDRLIAKYNQCLRLARYASNYHDRWILGRALAAVVTALGPFLVALGSEGKSGAEFAFAESALRICKVAIWICRETGDQEGAVIVILAALMTARSTDSDGYRWALQMAQSLTDPEIRSQALLRIERNVKRWRNENVEGDYEGNVVWQIIQNISSGLGIDLGAENAPMVRALKIAAKDNSPERVLANCEHIVVTRGATGPLARQVRQLFNITTAGSKVINCTLHNFHVEGKEMDLAYEEFRRMHCDSCVDQKPRPDGWRYTEEVRTQEEARNLEFVMRLAGTQFRPRSADQD